MQPHAWDAEFLDVDPLFVAKISHFFHGLQARSHVNIVVVAQPAAGSLSQMCVSSRSRVSPMLTKMGECAFSNVSMAIGCCP